MKDNNLTQEDLKCLATFLLGAEIYHGQMELGCKNICKRVQVDPFTKQRDPLDCHILHFDKVCQKLEETSQIKMHGWNWRETWHFKWQRIRFEKKAYYGLMFLAAEIGLLAIAIYHL